MVHYLIILPTHSAFALNLLATFYFLVVSAIWSWAAKSSPSVFPYRLLDNHLFVVTVSKWDFFRILGYWLCNAFFFHFSSFIDFILDLNMCFRALAFSETDLSFLFSNSAIVTSLLNFVTFLVIKFLAFHRSCSSTSFGYCPSLYWSGPIVAVLKAVSTSINPFLQLFLGYTAFLHLL